MRRFGQLLMALGACVGVTVAVAILAHLGLSGVSWLVNVALAKLGFVASLALISAGAVGVRLANRREQRELPRGGTDSRGGA